MGCWRLLGKSAKHDSGWLLGIIGRVSSVYLDKAWLARYRASQPDRITPEYGTMLEAFSASVARDPAVVLSTARG